MFSIGITFDIKIEAKKNKMHQLEQIYGLQYERMGKMVCIEITGQPLYKIQHFCCFIIQLVKKLQQRYL